MAVQGRSCERLSFANLRQFLEVLKRDNDLKIIEAQVDPYLELAEIHRRVIEQEGPALLFTNVKGSPFPVVTNLFGTSRRVDLAFGPKPEALMKQIIGATDRLMPPTLKALWGEKNLILDMMKVGMKEVPASNAPILGSLKRERPLSRPSSHYELAGGWRSIRYAAACLHRESQCSEAA